LTVIAPFPAETSAAGAFVRQDYPIRDRISADGSTGFRAEPGRYHLYVAYGCPWAHRAVIARKLLGLEEVVSLSVVAPIRDERGWAFYDGPGHTADPVNGFQFLSEAYLLTDPSYNVESGAVSDALVDQLVAQGNEDAVARRLSDLLDSGLDELLLTVVPVGDVAVARSRLFRLVGQLA
jgi:putative glutathione S-transferase